MWPTGPDGMPLPKDADGAPLWPSDDWRRAYEVGLAHQRAGADARWRVWRVLLAVVVGFYLLFILGLFR